MNLIDAEKNVSISPAPEWILFADSKKEQDSCSTDLLHLEKQIHCGLKMRFYRFIRQFETMKSVQNGSVLELDFNPCDEMLVLHSLSIFRQTEEIDKLPGINKKLIQKEAQSHNFIYTGIWTLVIILEDVREGDILEYAYSYKDIDLFKEDFFQDVLYLEAHRPTRRIFLRLVAPIERTSLKYHGISQIPLIQDLDNSFREWIWDISDTKAPILEPDLPSWYNPYSWVQISSFRNWDEVAKSGQGIFKTSSELSPSIKKQINQWKEEYSTIQDITTVIIHFVQKEIRYLSLNENKISNCVADPNLVYTRRFGDCKDKTWLLCLMLREIGILSYPALVNTQLKDKIVSFLPSFQFNHAILAIEFEEMIYWIDPTLTFQGGKFNSKSEETHGYALLIGKPGHSLVLMNCGTESKTVSLVTFDLIRHQENGTMQVETKYYHENANNMRAFLTQITPEELTKNYTNYSNKFYHLATSLHTTSIEDLSDLNVITIKEAYSVSNLGVCIKEKNLLKYVYTIHPLTLFSNLILNIDITRKSPLAIAFPLNIQEEILVRSPKKLNIKDKENKITNEYYEYTERWIKENSQSYRVIFSLKTLKDHVAVEHLPEIKNFMDELSKSLTFTLAFMKTSDKVWGITGTIFLLLSLFRFLLSIS
jgi:hypothetical protein